MSSCRKIVREWYGKTEFDVKYILSEAFTIVVDGVVRETHGYIRPQINEVLQKIQG